jgi:hypothetical protein
MIVVPRRLDLAKIAAGIADTLITRAAAVALKERMRLVLCVRETPLSTIALENMAKLSREGVVIMPLSLPYYRATTLDAWSPGSSKILALLGGTPARLARSGAGAGGGLRTLGSSSPLERRGDLRRVSREVIPSRSPRSPAEARRGPALLFERVQCPHSPSTCRGAAAQMGAGPHAGGGGAELEEILTPSAATPGRPGSCVAARAGSWRCGASRPGRPGVAPADLTAPQPPALAGRRRPVRHLRPGAHRASRDARTQPRDLPYAHL